MLDCFQGCFPRLFGQRPQRPQQWHQFGAQGFQQMRQNYEPQNFQLSGQNYEAQNFQQSGQTWYPYYQNYQQHQQLQHPSPVHYQYRDDQDVPESAAYWTHEVFKVLKQIEMRGSQNQPDGPGALRHLGQVASGELWVLTRDLGQNLEVLAQAGLQSYGQMRAQADRDRGQMWAIQQAAKALGQRYALEPNHQDRVECWPYK